MPVSVLPQPDSCQIWLDFDGTVTKQDVLDVLIQKYSVNESWKIVEDRWQAGLIGSRDCLEAQFDLLRITPEQLKHELEHIKIDKGVRDLLYLAERLSIPLAILSDNTETSIRYILNHNQISTDIPIRANSMQHQGNRTKLLCPNADPKCQVKAAHCKCASAKLLAEPGRKSIYIGDGRSDLCPARKMDYVFAKNALARCLEQEGIPFTPFRTLHEIAVFLAKSWQLEEEIAELTRSAQHITN
jgi:2-hydroxy-3-keto-5-methylthiopentenyl-1-phosphate phosphatase